VALAGDNGIVSRVREQLRYHVVSVLFDSLESGIIEARGAEPYAPSVVFSRIIDPPQRNDVVAQRN